MISKINVLKSVLLQERTASSSAFTRATVVIAIKYTIVERPQPIDAYVKPCIASFLMLIKDDDRVCEVISLCICNRYSNCFSFFHLCCKRFWILIGGWRWTYPVDCVP